MGIQASISISVPALPENDIWFANAAAWSNYWNNITGNITIQPIQTALYVPTPYNAGLQPYTITVDGVDYVVVSREQFNSLKSRMDTLDAAFQSMRTSLRDGGLITNAQ